MDDDGLIARVALMTTGRFGNYFPGMHPGWQRAPGGGAASRGCGGRVARDLPWGVAGRGRLPARRDSGRVAVGDRSTPGGPVPAPRSSSHWECACAPPSSEQTDDQLMYYAESRDPQFHERRGNACARIGVRERPVNPLAARSAVRGSYAAGRSAAAPGSLRSAAGPTQLRHRLFSGVAIPSE